MLYYCDICISREGIFKIFNRNRLKIELGLGIFFGGSFGFVIFVSWLFSLKLVLICVILFGL